MTLKMSKACLLFTAKTMFFSHFYKNSIFNSRTFSHNLHNEHIVYNLYILFTVSTKSSSLLTVQIKSANNFMMLQRHILIIMTFPNGVAATVFYFLPGLLLQRLLLS